MRLSSAGPGRIRGEQPSCPLHCGVFPGPSRSPAGTSSDGPLWRAPPCSKCPGQKGPSHSCSGAPQSTRLEVEPPVVGRLVRPILQKLRKGSHRIEEVSHNLRDLQGVGGQAMLRKDGVDRAHSTGKVIVGKIGPAGVPSIRLCLIHQLRITDSAPAGKICLFLTHLEASQQRTLSSKVAGGGACWRELKGPACRKDLSRIKRWTATTSSWIFLRTEGFRDRTGELGP